MSVISTLEHLPLPHLLRRIEAYTKTGLMTVKQASQTIEMYFQKGKLMFASFTQAEHTLGERLIRDGMLTEQRLQEAVASTHETTPGETRLALALMNLGYIKREELREWMKNQVTDVMRVLLSWKQGSVAFEEDVDAPAERLLVSLDISPLLDTILSVAPVPLSISEEECAKLETQMMPASLKVAQNELQPQRANTVEQSLATSQPARSLQLRHEASPTQNPQPMQAIVTRTKKRDVTQAPTLVESSQFYAKSTESPLPLPPSALVPQAQNANATIPASSFIDANAFFSALNAVSSSGADHSLQVMPPTITPAPPASYVPPRRVDTSFMRPHMVMVPVDQSSSREQWVQITPEQWLLLARVDGQTSLQELCTLFNLSDVSVREIAGQLIVEKLIQVVPPQPLEGQQGSSPALPQTQKELSPSSRELVMAGLHNGIATPGYHASMPPAWGDVLPDSTIPHSPSSLDTQSQRSSSNMSLAIGQGWATSSQQLLAPANSSFARDSYSVVERR